MPVTISAAVGRDVRTGRDAQNLPDDVRRVQTLLRVAHQLARTPPADIDVDGHVGPRTREAISRFQQANLGFADGIVEPSGPTLSRLNAIAGSAVIKVLRAGDTTKTNPFTVAIVSNPSLETPWNSGTFSIDPVTFDQAAFDACARYIDDSLAGTLPGQRERFIAESGLLPYIRIVSVFLTGADAVDGNSLAAQDGVSNLLVARAAAFAPLLLRFGIQADVAYAVSASSSHNRASAWFTSDNDAGPGTSFTLDGITRVHRFFNLVPGTVALHTTSRSLTALHEFGHALSSYTNGQVVDLYVDSAAALNNKRRRPIPLVFGEYAGTGMNTDHSRAGLGYPVGWQSFHCELMRTESPAVMDDYWADPSGIPEQCLHDRITRQFLIDRLRAKISR